MVQTKTQNKQEVLDNNDIPLTHSCGGKFVHTITKTEILYSCQKCGFEDIERRR